MLVDTDIVIDYLRGVAEAVDFVERHIDQIAVSAITVGELYSGVRDGDEKVALDDFVSAINVLVVDQEIGKTAGIYRGEYRKSHQLGLADCLIGQQPAEIDCH